MTYIEVVNQVLRRLRENTVSTVGLTDYSLMVGDFVNDAKTQVEDSWNWSQLRENVPVTTVNGTNTYSLTGFTDKSNLLYAINDTSNFCLEYRSRAWVDQRLYTQEVLSGEPQYYTFAGVDSNGDAQVILYPTPDAAYTLRFDSVIRGTELVNDTDTVVVPHRPVIHLALALLARERGENGGTTTAEYFAIAQRHLNDAIAYDAARHPEELIWTS